MAKNAINLIKQFEGLSLKPYLCPAGLATIGYGHVVVKDGRQLRSIDGIENITESEAERLLDEDLEKFRHQLDSLHLDINTNQYEALLSFIFNVGFGKFVDSTLLYRVKNRGDIKEAFLMWVKAGGKVLKGLVKRREAEYALFSS